MGPQLDQSLLVMGSSCLLLKSNVRIRSLKIDSCIREEDAHELLCFFLPRVATLNTPLFSAFYLHLTLELVYYEWLACYSPWAQALMLASSDNTK